MREMRNAFEILVGNPEGYISRGRPSGEWDGDIKMDLLRNIVDAEWLRRTDAFKHE